MAIIANSVIQIISVHSLLFLMFSVSGHCNYIAYGCTGTYLDLNCTSTDRFIVVTETYYERSNTGNCQYTEIKCTHRLTSPVLHFCTGFQSCRWLIPQYQIPSCGEGDHAIVAYTCPKVSAVLNICDKTVGVLDEQEGYIASPGYTTSYSVTGSNTAGQYQPNYLCALTVKVPPGSGFTTLHFYVKDLHFRSNHAPTTPTDPESSDNTTKQTNPHQTCLQFAEVITNNSHGNVKKICSLREIGARGLVFMSSSFQVEITYWSFAEEFNDFLVFYKAIMVKTTTRPTLPGHAELREVTTQHPTLTATENQIHSPTPAGSLADATTTALHNSSGWDNPFSGQKETKPWATAVGAVIGCIAAILMIVLIVVIIVEKKRKDIRKERRIYDEVPHPATDDSSAVCNERNREIYENTNVHTNAAFVDELNDIIKSNIQNTTKSPNSRKMSKSPSVPNKAENSSTLVDKTESIEANADIPETCEEETLYEESEPVRSLTESKTQDIFYVNHEATASNCDNNDISEETTMETVLEQSSAHNNIETNRLSPQMDLEKAQEIYENAAFPVKYSRIATPRICERSRQGSKKGKPPTRKGYLETEPVLQKLERPKVAIRRNPSVVSQTELIYDDVPDETAEDEDFKGSKTNGLVKPPLKPKPRLSKIMKNKNKNPSPRMKPADDTIMIDNEVYTGTS